MHQDVLLGPIFQDLLRDYELSVRKFRDAVVALRAHHLSHCKSPSDEDISEKWRSATLQNTASLLHDKAQEAADLLLRYGYEIAPHSSCPRHLSDVEKARSDHKDRINRRSGWSESAAQVRGIEEQVRVDMDGGMPLTIILRPEYYKFSDRFKKTGGPQEPAMNRPNDELAAQNGGPDESTTGGASSEQE